jgi:hypothetical protein
MNPETIPCELSPDSASGRRWLPKAMAIVAAVGMVCFGSSLAAQEKQDKESAGGKGSQGAGIYFNAEASAKDVGLPIYPGARPHKEKGDDVTASPSRWGFGETLLRSSWLSSSWSLTIHRKKSPALQEGFSQVRDGAGLRRSSFAKWR